jgi:hypothetical protein
LAPAVAAAAATPAAPTPGNPPHVAAPVKITIEQNKAVQQALRTIPGKMTRAEQRTFDRLSTLVDRAVTNGLTPREASALKEGLNALAIKHPKAEQQHNFKSLAKVLTSQPADSSRSRPSAAPHALAAAPAAVAPKPSVASRIPSAPIATESSKGVSAQKPHDVVVKTRAVQTPERHQAPKPAPVPPKAPSVKVQAARKPQIARTPLKTPVVNKPHPVVAAPRPSMVAPHPAVVARRPAVAAAPPRPAVVAPKPPTCTPNMVNGKVTGMICH